MGVFRIGDGLLDDPAAQRLSAREFRRQFIAALSGEENAVSPFVRPEPQRLPAHEWIPLRAFVLARDNHTCRYCGEHGGRLECDHVHPVSRGGTHHPENLVTACFACNRSKRDKTVEEWIG